MAWGRGPLAGNRLASGRAAAPARTPRIDAGDARASGPKPSIMPHFAPPATAHGASRRRAPHAGPRFQQALRRAVASSPATAGARRSPTTSTCRTSMRRAGSTSTAKACSCSPTDGRLQHAHRASRVPGVAKALSGRRSRARRPRMRSAALGRGIALGDGAGSRSARARSRRAIADRRCRRDPPIRFVAPSRRRGSRSRSPKAAIARCGA